MITYNDLNKIAEEMCEISPGDWLSAEGIPPEILKEYTDKKLEATRLMILMDGSAEGVEGTLAASTCASFQTGWEAHKRFGAGVSVMRGLVGMLRESQAIAQRTTTMGNALAESLNLAVDCLQQDTDPQSTLDQIQAILVTGYKEAYPE
jgi:hypothetical protein